MASLKQTKSVPKKEGIRLNRRVITFFICVIISVFFWLLLSLSKEYIITLSFPVNYINLPKDKVLANELPETIDIEIKSTGFKLLIYKLKQRRETVSIDIKDSKPSSDKNHNYLYTGSRIDKIITQFNSEIEVLKVSPDTLFFNFNKKIRKTVPVKSNLTITYDNHYQPTDSIQISPETIEISGAADVINQISFVETKEMNIVKVAKSGSQKLEIKITPILKQVEMSAQYVNAIISVTKYTEGTVELPIEVENLPAGYTLKTFPDKVIIKYNVAFNNYEKIKAAQFRAVVDYAKIVSNSNKLKINIVKHPEEVRAIKLNTEKVEYIIRK